MYLTYTWHFQMNWSNNSLRPGASFNSANFLWTWSTINTLYKYFAIMKQSFLYYSGSVSLVLMRVPFSGVSPAETGPARRRPPPSVPAPPWSSAPAVGSLARPLSWAQRFLQPDHITLTNNFYLHRIIETYLCKDLFQI